MAKRQLIVQKKEIMGNKDSKYPQKYLYLSKRPKFSVISQKEDRNFL